ncbi:hypothetical protein [Pseudomonas aeruginosa]|uniref:hypothetical protein n=1 Tax=Pseudomonas aeruginosa TaxID=287 RepID=UPI0015B9B918|nr:hypothetical protein [Pseudomonas aeruginosa]EKW5974349.1 hypothetical protein [Pseudomonas aeruginosa]EMB5660448.1 hypothetical protein [Pseudomonas aeruginosa]MBX6202717.1 hypothetical protein [Pseudomonas aeruginosa]MBX6760754.1 hypothetical protein [Pseudomonas aeruginosa]MCT5895755.1 hypothetical protein [Pseudomonas aeruginosa]
MMDAISGALTAVTSVLSLSKDISNARTDHEIAVKTGELSERLGQVLEMLITAQTGYLTLLEEKRQLEADLVQFKDWTHEKQRYQLHQFPAGALAYRIKPEMQGSEPAHEICADCYQKGIKTILQPCTDGWYKALKCHPCKSVVHVEKIPDSGPVVVSRYDPFSE